MKNPTKEQKALIKAMTLINEALIDGYINPAVQKQFERLGKELVKLFMESKKAKKEPKPKRTFGGNWCADDIRTVVDEMNEEKEEGEMAIELDDDEIESIMDDIESNHDASIGINWEVIRCVIECYLQSINQHK